MHKNWLGGNLKDVQMLAKLPPKASLRASGMLLQTGIASGTPFWRYVLPWGSGKTSKSIPTLQKNCFKNQSFFSYRFWFNFWLTFWSQKALPSASEASQKLLSQQGRFWCSNFPRLFGTCVCSLIHTKYEHHNFSSVFTVFLKTRSLRWHVNFDIWSLLNCFHFPFQKHRKCIQIRAPTHSKIAFCSCPRFCAILSSRTHPPKHRKSTQNQLKILSENRDDQKTDFAAGNPGGDPLSATPDPPSGHPGYIYRYI